MTTRTTEKIDAHYFRVELTDISPTNRALLDKNQVQDYLDFVAPVPYRNTFTPRYKIYKYAQLKNYTIDEYNIYLDGEQIYKEYRPTIITSKGEDEITDVDFYDLKTDDGKLVAWLWFGITKFKAVLKKGYKGRGIRLRKANIQIGDEDTLQELFNEDRGQHYFVGEVFAVDKELIPNSQRNHFNENDARAELDRLLRAYFNENLFTIYRYGSAINSAAADISKANKLAEGINKMQTQGGQDTSIDHHYTEVWSKAEQKQKELAKIKGQLAKKIESGSFQPADMVVSAIIEQVSEPLLPAPTSTLSASKPTNKTSQKSPATTTYEPQNRPRMISFERVKEIITQYATPLVANFLISKIDREAR